MINVLKEWSVSIILILLIIGIGVVLVLSSNGVIGFGTGSKSSNSNMKQFNINPTNNSNSPMKPNSNNNSMIMPQMNSGSQEEDFKTLIDDVKKIIANQNVTKEDIKDLSNNQDLIKEWINQLHGKYNKQDQLDKAKKLEDQIWHQSLHSQQSESDIASIKDFIEVYLQDAEQSQDAYEATKFALEDLASKIALLSEEINSGASDNSNQVSDTIILTEQATPILESEFIFQASFSPIVYDDAPLGNKIAYAYRESFNDNYDIYVMNSDGTDPINITNDPESNDINPSWSPDGTKIAWAKKRIKGIAHKYEIYYMNADGSGTQERVTINSAYDDRSPSWSPDGSVDNIVFESNREGNYEIYTMSKKFPEFFIILSNSPGIDRNPSWSPDGKNIVFESNRNGNFEIYVMNADGTNVIQLTSTSTGDDLNPSWSPDGTKIAFRSTRYGETGDIYVMNVDGTNQTDISNHNIYSDLLVKLYGEDSPYQGWYQESQPSWSADGSKILFTSNFLLNEAGGIFTIGVGY